MAVRKRSTDAQEARQQETEAAQQEQVGATAHDLGVAPDGYVHAVSPIHGEPVVFAPGQLLPGWAAGLWRQQQPRPDEHGVYTLEGK